ncbi:hypothetical protein T459_20215 [Capsicum annuum]|uniref:DUF21 domain-containing protein n=1 Tax=Capsicum annuum TaxID=4072 RepID=A0A2G2Z3Z5_CAPAN|nr:hypothetical protein T459_20215 [Capsicum annuum]
MSYPLFLPFTSLVELRAELSRGCALAKIHMSYYKVLDWMLGKGHVALLRIAELKKFVYFHRNEARKGGDLTPDETTIIVGALELTEKYAKDAMTPISKAFSLDLDGTLNWRRMCHTRNELSKSNFLYYMGRIDPCSGTAADSIVMLPTYEQEN